MMNGMPVGIRLASFSSMVWTVLCMRAPRGSAVLRASERVEALLRREMHVRDRNALAPAHAKAHGGDDDMIRLDVIHAETAHEVQTPLDTGKALVQLLGAWQVINQREHLDRVGADIETERRALPVDFPPRTALVEQLATPVAQAHTDGATA